MRELIDITTVKLPKGYKWTEEALESNENDKDRGYFNAVSTDKNNYIHSLLFNNSWKMSDEDLKKGYFEVQFFTDPFMYEKPVKCKCCGHTPDGVFKEDFVELFSSLKGKDWSHALGDVEWQDPSYPNLDNKTINRINKYLKNK